MRKNDNWKKFSSDHELFENLKKWDNGVPGLRVIGIPSKKCEKCYKMKAVDRKMVQKVGQIVLKKWDKKWDKFLESWFAQ